MENTKSIPNNTDAMLGGVYFKVKIIKHTKLLFGNKYEDCWHKSKIGETIIVRKTDWDGSYYETKNGESILKTDCRIVSNKIKGRM